MTFRSLTTLMITAAIALGSFNLASASVVPGHKGGGNPSAGGPSTPDAGSDDVFKVFLGDQPGCNRANIAGVNCVVLPPKPRPVRVFLTRDPVHCVDTDHRRIVLPNGDVVIQQSQSKIKYCDDLHTMQ